MTYVATKHVTPHRGMSEHSWNWYNGVLREVQQWAL